MSVYKESNGRYRYAFWKNKQRYRKRGFRTRKLAEDAERAKRDRLTKIDAGIITASDNGPRFTEWAGDTYTYAVERLQLTDPESFDHNLRCILRFWGRKPTDPAKVVAGEPYHDLALDDPIRDGAWLLKFEDWMSKKGLAGSTKNHYRSACSRLYFVAMQPEYRAVTGIMTNPFRGILRDRTRNRDVVFTRPQLQAVLVQLPPFLKLALRIALLAPKLRLGNILALRWDQHLDPDLAWIRVAEHKTARKTGRPLVSPIVPSLRRFLQEARAETPRGCQSVVQWDGRPLNRWLVARELRRACEAAGIVYGLASGVTFHSLRHTAGTIMAELGLPEAQRKEAIGHLAIATTQIYTHLMPEHTIAPLTLLANELDPSVQEPVGFSPARRRRRPAGAVSGAGLKRKRGKSGTTNAPRRTAKEGRKHSRKRALTDGN